MKWLLLTILVGSWGYVSCRPQSAAPSAGGAKSAAGAPGTSEGLPLSWLMSAMPRTGITGFFDNFGAAMANFGNAQGAGLDALFSGAFNAVGTLFSGMFGSGAINTAFLNYNNRPPVDAGPPAAPAAGAGGGAKPDAPPPADDGGK